MPDGTEPGPAGPATPEPEPTPAAAADTSTDVTAAEETDEVTAKLTELGADETIIADIKAMGVTSVEDLAMLTEADLTSNGVPVIQARKLVGAFAPVAPATDAVTMPSAAFDVLPSLPDDPSWLEALRTGGVSKVDQSTVISVVRAAIANRVELYEVPAKLVGAMEKFADSNDEPVDPEFFRLRKQLTRRNYGEIFEAIDGLDGSYVTEPRKKDLFRRVDDFLWPAINGFYGQLKGWQESWMQGANPMVMLASAMSGPGGFMLPPGMMQPPDTGVLRDYADAVNDAVNRVFAGTGVQVAAALAYEATQIKTTLENPRLPAMIGAANRDQMLKQLGVAVNATYPRLEKNLTTFVLGTMQVGDQPGGNEELQYFGALIMLGSQIPWDQLGAGGSGYSTIKGGKL